MVLVSDLVQCNAIQCNAMQEFLSGHLKTCLNDTGTAVVHAGHSMRAQPYVVLGQSRHQDGSLGRQ
jgi:hypothetical protein